MRCAPYFPARTNLVTHSQALGNWTAFAATVGTDAALAPDGTQTAERITVSAEAHRVVNASTVTPEQAYTFSVYGKNNGGTAASYSVYCATGAPGNIVAPTSYLAQLSETEWRRIEVPFTAPAGCTEVYVYVVRDSGVGVDLFAWGAQLETGARATPRIATGENPITMPPGCYR